MRLKEVIVTQILSITTKGDTRIWKWHRENLGCYWRFKIDYHTEKGSDIIKNIMS